jgi:hypothetical protein
MSVDYCSVSVTLVVNLILRWLASYVQIAMKISPVISWSREICEIFADGINTVITPQPWENLGYTRGYIMRYPRVWVKCVQNYEISNKKSSRRQMFQS